MLKFDLEIDTCSYGTNHPQLIHMLHVHAGIAHVLHAEFCNAMQSMYGVHKITR